MEFLIGIILGVTIVVLYLWYCIARFAKRIEAQINTLITEAQSKIVPVVVERENGAIYCYSKDDHQFICQGRDLVEIRQAFELRFPDKTAFLAGGDEEVLEELRSQLKSEAKI